MFKILSSVGMVDLHYYHYDYEVFTYLRPLWLFAEQAFLILALQTLELCIVLLLIKCPGKPQYDFPDFFRAKKSSKHRSWLLASMLGFGVLVSLVFITSYFAESLLGPKVNLPVFKIFISACKMKLSQKNFSHTSVTLSFYWELENYDYLQQT